ncbi:unnamed protein product [Prunus brigantina]
MRCGCERACQHGLPCVVMVMGGDVGGGFWVVLRRVAQRATVV